MVCVEAQSAEEADTIALYATQYPDDLEGVHYVNYRFHHSSSYFDLDGQSDM
jgi:hypothetical protein